jgi:hypothetical protein
MAQYVDKDAVVTEIERLISNGQTKLKEAEERKDYESYVALAERIATCINILSFLDTLEVKEVDLKKEIQLWIEDNSVNGYYKEDVYETSEHFFELGLKAQTNIKLPNLDDIFIENGIDPNSKQAKIFKENYYIALEKLKAQKGE